MDKRPAFVKKKKGFSWVFGLVSDRRESLFTVPVFWQDSTGYAGYEETIQDTYIGGGGGKGTKRVGVSLIIRDSSQ